MKQLEGFENIPEPGSEEFSLLLPFVLLLFVGTLSEVSSSDTGSHYPEVPKFGSVGKASTIVKDHGFPCCEEKAILIPRMTD